MEQWKASPEARDPGAKLPYAATMIFTVKQLKMLTWKLSLNMIAVLSTISGLTWRSPFLDPGPGRGKGQIMRRVIVWTNSCSVVLK